MIRILHCSDSLDNYYLCLKKKVIGFKKNGPKQGDLIYISVSFRGVSLCGARVILGEKTDCKPWEYPSLYVASYKASSIEFCKPFKLSELKQIGEKYWGIKYVQGAKAIHNNDVIKLLDKLFDKHKCNELVALED